MEDQIPPQNQSQDQPQDLPQPEVPVEEVKEKSQLNTEEKRIEEE